MAFIVIDAELNAEKEMIEALNEIPEVQEVYSIYGVYDMIVRIETKTMQELKNVIAFKIRRLSQVRSTLTMIVVE